MWVVRPILAVHRRPQMLQGKVFEGMTVGLELAAGSFRRLRFSVAEVIRFSSKCFTPVRQVIRHFDLSLARSSHVLDRWQWTSSCLCSAALDDLEAWNMTAVQSRRQPLGSCHWAFWHGDVQTIKVVLWWWELLCQILCTRVGLLYWVFYLAIWSWLYGTGSAYGTDRGCVHYADRWSKTHSHVAGWQ